MFDQQVPIYSRPSEKEIRKRNKEMKEFFEKAFDTLSPSEKLEYQQINKKMEKMKEKASKNGKFLDLLFHNEEYNKMSSRSIELYIKATSGARAKGITPPEQKMPERRFPIDYSFNQRNF